MSLRLDQPGGARDPRHRDEPARRQVQHRRGRRGPRAPVRPGAPLARSSRSRRAASASPREYLTNADDIQIKMAQGAKPGEGGQLPGHEGLPVDRQDPALHARRRADLAAAAPRHLLDRGPRAADPRPQERQPRGARSTSSWSPRSASARSRRACPRRTPTSSSSPGHDGGTGASPLTSLKHAGGPWELGLAETQQTLLLNGLRDRIVVQVDGQLKTGRDVVIAALLGAEEFGFATAPLVVSRLHHDAGLPPRHLPGRRRHAEPGAARAVHRQGRSSSSPSSSTSPRRSASSWRQLGFRTIDEAIGHAELLDTRRPSTTGRPPGSTSRRSCTCPSCPRARRCTNTTRAGPRPRQGARPRAHRARRATRSSDGEPVRVELPIRNVNRTVGTMLGHEVTKRYRGEGLPDGTIDLTFTGLGRPVVRRVPARAASRCGSSATPTTTSARACPAGGSSCGPTARRTFAAEATSSPATSSATAPPRGEIFLRGLVGERFCVRNSGATAVVEGVGDHGCEYMTGGTRRRPRPHRPQLRRRHVRRRGLRARPRREPGQRASWSSSSRVDGDADRRAARRWCDQHAEETESPVAERAARRLGAALARFTGSCPRDYQRVLEARAAGARRRGTRPTARHDRKRIMEAAARG